jgi:hypothetical protein
MRGMALSRRSPTGMNDLPEIIFERGFVIWDMRFSRWVMMEWRVRQAAE